MNPAPDRPIRLQADDLLPDKGGEVPSFWEVLRNTEAAMQALVTERDNLARALGEARDEIQNLTEQRDGWERWGYQWKRRAEERVEQHLTESAVVMSFGRVADVTTLTIPGRRYGHCPTCRRWFWTTEGYRGHYVVAHMLIIAEEGKK